MDELTLDDKKYLSSKRAAQVTGYAKDYVGQLCREGRVAARLVGRNWYVLESSILEHRFGAEESADAPAEPTLRPTEAWESPKYSPETVSTVPEVQKAAVPAQAVVAQSEPDNRKVLSDMQSAWEEWFQNQEKRAEETLPDASEMLLADHEEAPITFTEVEAPAEEPAEALDEALPVHIERIEEPAAPIAHAPVFEMERREVAIRRQEPETARYTTEETYTERIEPKRRMAQPAAAPTHRRGNAVAKAVLLSVIGLVLVITALGSGAFDRVITSSPVTDFFAGVHTVQK